MSDPASSASTAAAATLAAPSSTPSSASAPASAPQAPPSPPQLDQTVSELVSGFSSWWGGVSKKIAPAVETARTNLQQGSQTFIAAAKDEISRFEASLEEAQRRAREEEAAAARAGAGAAAGAGDAGAASGLVGGPTERSAPVPSKGKGKGREEVSLDELSELEGPEGALRAQAAHAPTPAPLVFDADGDVISGGRAPDDRERELEHKVEAGFEQGLARAQALVSNVTRQLGDDPRVQSLQASLAGWAAQAGEQIKQRAAAPASAAGAGADAAGNGGDGASATSPRSSSDLFTSLSHTLQTSLPHLDWEQSQALAQKAWERSEEFTKDVAQGVRDLAGELVQVTPQDQEGGSKGQKSNPAIAASALAAPGLIFDDATPVPTPPPSTPRKNAAPASDSATGKTQPKPAAPLKSALKQPAAAPAPATEEAAKAALLSSSSAPSASAEPKPDTWGFSDDDSSPAPTPAPASASVHVTKDAAPTATSKSTAAEDSDSDWE